jgi:uncharacterized protein (TIGR00369 family)
MSPANVTSERTSIERLRAEMERPPYHGFLRPRAEQVDEATGAVTITLPFRPEFRRAPDAPGCHRGMIAGLIDLTAHAAVADRVGGMVPTIDLHIDFLRVASDVDLSATASIRRTGRTLAVADAGVSDTKAHAVALSRGLFGTAPPAP